MDLERVDETPPGPLLDCALPAVGLVHRRLRWRQPSGIRVFRQGSPNRRSAEG